MQKVFLALLVSLSSLLFINNVSASSIADIQSYASNITEENIDLFFQNNNVDRSIYDAYLIVVSPNFYNGSSAGRKPYVRMYWFNYQDMLNEKIRVQLSKDTSSFLSYRFNVQTTKTYSFFNFSRYLTGTYLPISDFPNISSEAISTVAPTTQVISTIVSGPNSTTLAEPLAYYSNVDILMNDGSVWLEKNDGPTLYQYDDTVSADVSKVKFTFDIPDNNGELDFFLDYSVMPNIQYDNPFSSFQPPFVELEREDGKVVNIIPDYSDINDTSMPNYYKKILNTCFNQDSKIVRVSFVIDKYDYPDSLKVKFESLYDYDVTYEYKETVKDYYVTIDMNNYMSATLIPKVHDNTLGSDTSLYSPIYLVGEYNIKIYDNYVSEDNNSLLIEYKNYHENSFAYDFHYKDNSYFEQYETVMHFIKNASYSKVNKITFDTRYYSYSLKTHVLENTTIVSPNTGQEITIGSIDVNPNEFTDSTGFLQQMESTSKIFNEMFENFFYSLPGILQGFLLFIWNGLLIMLCLSLGGYK